jgi:hypothetical protein
MCLYTIREFHAGEVFFSKKFIGLHSWLMFLRNLKPTSDTLINLLAIEELTNYYIYIRGQFNRQSATKASYFKRLRSLGRLNNVLHLSFKCPSCHETNLWTKNIRTKTNSCSPLRFSFTFALNAIFFVQRILIIKLHALTYAGTYVYAIYSKVCCSNYDANHACM